MPPVPRTMQQAYASGVPNLSREGARIFGETFRPALLAAGENPDALWCRKCSTALEDIRDSLEDSGPAMLRVVATVASLVPGIGSGVAAALGAAASLAEGHTLDEAFVAGALSALPGGPAWVAVGETARGVINGDRVDRAALSGLREGIRAEGGDMAAAAFDATIAIAQGKSLQDAGFAALKALARGNSLAERGAAYAEAIATAAEQGRDVGEVLVSNLASDLARAAGSASSALVDSAVSRIKAQSSLLAVGSDALASMLGVAEPVARAAQSIMRTGELDAAMRSALVPPVALGRVESAAERALNDPLAARGFSMSLASPLIASTRRAGPSDEWRRGFDIGTAVSVGNSQSGPGQDAVLARLHTVPLRSGFLAARAQQYDQTQYRAARVRDDAIALQGYAAPGPTPAEAEALAAVASSTPVAASSSASSSLAIGAGVGALGLVVAWALWRR